MTISSKKLWLTTKDYFMIVFGIILYSFGFTAFILPEKVVIGGVTGIGTIFYLAFGIPVAVMQYLVNLILLAMAFRMVGKAFVLKTIFGATAVSLFIGLLQPVFEHLPRLLPNDTFLNVILGGIACGVGIGIAFTHNGSTGGTDIVAAMVSKRTNVSVGRAMLYTDMLIIVLSHFILGNEIEKIVYGLIVIFFSSWVADHIVYTNRQAVQFTIFSSYWDEIASAINKEAKRGCTVIDGQGWYSRQDVKMLLVMCRKIEAVTIFRIIKSIDKDAFVTQTNVNGVYGNGFDQVKLRNLKQRHLQGSQSPAPETSPGGDGAAEPDNQSGK